MILGIDGGLATCGWCIVDPSASPIRVVDLGLIRTEPTALDESTDRAYRQRRQSAELLRIARHHEVKAIAAEAMSFGGAPAARFRMAVSLGLCWGSLVMLSVAIDATLYEVPPKQWQHAVVPGVGKKKLDYDLVYRELHGFADKHVPVSLGMICKSDRNHPLDGMGVALFAALRPKETRRVAA